MAGLVLAAVTSWWLVLLGALAVAAAWTSPAAGTRPGYHGLGEIAVFVFFGWRPWPGPRSWRWGSATLAGAGRGAAGGVVACALLVIDDLRDIPNGQVSGKRTLAVILGDARTRTLYTACVLGPFVIAAVMAVARPLTLLVFAAIPLAVIPVRTVRHGATGPALIGALGMTGRLQLAFGALLTVGLAIRL